MTATLQTETSGAPAPAAPPPRGSLLRAEGHRMRSRRFIRVLVLLGLLGFAGLLAVASTQFAAPSAAGQAEAQAELERVLAESQVFYEQCLTSTDLPEGTSPEQFCGPRPTVESMGGPEQFVDERPFVLGEDGPAGAAVVAAATAAFAFLVGATWIGAEWSTRSIVALLFWEPRRVKVMLAKTTVLALTIAVLAAATQAVWAVAARVLAETRGTVDAPPGFWRELAAAGGRSVLLAVLVALLGFALANLIRNTAAALGAGFVYVVVVENAVRALRPAWQEWLLTTNAAALVLEGGTSFLLFSEGVTDRNGVFSVTEREVVVGNLQGGLVLTAVTLLVLGLGIVLFSRRDLD
ncbi:MAG: hypothetical protein AVDCRST_MAG07-2777 [uncultured Frankineae bacterium]|uniref:Uncharacterized protein n=1 Tax=uncultured Frankineae bacterium TaxID=437475 RepID=A0A6J4M115_9ACTN|nr:MAG: hypothetical protein AVDCRST_MAG07-2777 [uncultured Frankineae bacterium]